MQRVRGLPRRALGSAQAGRLFESSVTYALRETLPRDRVGFYVPRGSVHGLLLRHHSHDVSIVQEIFSMKLYEPPAPVLEALARLGRPPRVLDLGAHVGVFGAFILTIEPHAHVLSFEPDPQSFALLSVSARRSGRDWIVLEAAAAPETGWAPFIATGSPASRLTTAGVAGGNGARTTVLTLDVLPLLPRIDLAKIDIEGGEWPILTDPRWPHCAPQLLALEFHPQGCPGRDHQAAAIAALDSAGMDHALITDTPAGAGMLWAWRRS